MAESFFLQSTPASFFLSKEIDLIFDSASNNMGDNSSDPTNLPLPEVNLTSTTFAQNIPSVFDSNGMLNSSLPGNCSRTFYQGRLLSMVLEVQNMIGPPILVFGIVTNILTLLTLQQKGMDLSPYVHLSWLAIADMSGLTLILIDLYNDPFDRRWMLFRIYVYYPLSNVAAMMGVWIMVLVTLERCVVIRSIRANIRCTVSRARLQVLGVFLASFILNGPRFFWFQVTLTKEPTPSHCPPRYHICSYLQNWAGSNVLIWMYSCLNSFLPLCLLTTLNGFLIYSVHARRRRHPALGIAEGADTVWSSEQTRFTVTLIAIVGLFIVLVMPSAFSDKNILLPLLGVTRMTETVQVLQYISNFLMWLNMSINFLLYTAINKRFKAAFKCMVWGWRHRAQYWLCCWECRDSDKNYHLRNYRHHHYLHRQHHRYHNGTKSNPPFASNGSTSRSSRGQLAATRLNIRIPKDDSSNHEILTTSRASDEKGVSCGRRMSAVRAYLAKGLGRSKTSEVSIPLQPSVKSSSTVTSGSYSQTPTESTEICPMLSAAPSVPAPIEETDSLAFLPSSSPATPDTSLPTLATESKEYLSTSNIKTHDSSQHCDTTCDVKICQDENRNTDSYIKQEARLLISTTKPSQSQIANASLKETIATAVDGTVPLDGLAQLEMKEELPNPLTELRNVSA